jgi:hypothetical protein
MKYIYFIDLPLKMEPIQGSETSDISTQMPGKHPKENIFHLTHGERLKSQIGPYFVPLYSGVCAITRRADTSRDPRYHCEDVSKWVLRECM